VNFQNEINNLREVESKLDHLKTKHSEMENKLNVYGKHVSQLQDENNTLREKNTALENGLM
jgi:chromosome segregation ATPase